MGEGSVALAGKTQTETRRADARTFERWQAIARLSHPHVARVLEVGRREGDGEAWIFAVTEKAEETLADVLAARALTEEETREMLGPTLDALTYLHANGFVHGNLQPSEILALGETLKLSSVNMVRAEEMSPVEDVRALGLTILMALTQSTNAAAKLPEPFGSIVSHALERNPAARWGIPQIAARLRGEVVAAGRPVVPRWPLALGGAAVVGIALFFFAHAPRKAAPVPVAAKQRPAGKPAARAEAHSDAWYVVLATYDRRGPADQRARAIARRWPRFAVEVIKPEGAPQYLVVTGRSASQSGAAAVRRRARAAGLPRDAVVRRLRAERE